MSKVNEAITLLPDESLGGILREYNEVKRKARVGERIKTTNKSDFDTYEVGEVFVVTWSESNYVNFDDHVGGARDLTEYVVLEVSDVVRIDDTDGVNRGYRMVERKAAVGERVVITDWKADNHVAPSAYKNGDIASVTKKDYYAIVPHVGNPDFIALKEDEYRVLEPLTDAVQPQLSTLDPVDQYAENIAALTTEVQALKKRVATLESAKVASGPVNDALPSFAVKSDQQIRDEIVARAKADVKTLQNDRGRYNVSVYGCTATFSVKRDKRKVTVVLRGYRTGKTFAVGRAICAPGEVFNVHIGRAIALHRALGLEVPTEYMNVPAPTEVRVGDIVEGGVVYAVRPTHSRGGGVYMSADRGYTYINSRGHEWWALIEDAVILDDSRMSVEESEGVNA